MQGSRIRFIASAGCKCSSRPFGSGSPSRLRASKWNPHPAALTLIVLAATIAAAQETPKTQPALSPRQIILPPTAVAGAQATLAVLDSQGRLLPDVTVELSGGHKVTTDPTGRALFVAPDKLGTLTAKVSGLPLTASTPVVAPDAPIAEGSSAPGARAAKVRSYPHVLALHDRFTVEGSGFRGMADLNRVFLGDKQCLVLAASPRAVVILPGPSVPVGAVDLRIRVDEREVGQLPVSVVLLEISGPAEAVNAGGTGKLTLRAYGTMERLSVEVRNGSPEVVQLPKGNVQRLDTSGGEPNLAPVEVKFVTAGNYLVSARFISAEDGQPDLEQARKRLIAAREIASGNWSARIDLVLLKLDSAPQDLGEIRAELKSMLDDKPVPSLASLLDSAWRELR